MKKGTLFAVNVIMILIISGGLLAACGSSTPAPSLDGQALMNERCSVCHSLDRVTSAHHDAAQWKVTLDRMVVRGAQLNASEEQVLLDYLSANYK